MTINETLDNPGCAGGALAGLRVLEICTVMMGPLAAVTLADFGADVVKVEPIGGDMSRWIGVAAPRTPGMSSLTMNLQRNKRSISIDLTHQEGRRILDDLIRDADVLITNLRPRSREKLGLEWAALASINPGIVLCTTQAYGSQTDRRDLPAYDDIVQAASGLTSLSVKAGGAREYTPFVIADKVVALYMVSAILAAVVHQRRSGEGQWVDVPMVDTMVAFNLVEHLGGQTFVPPAGDFGWQRALTPGRHPHQTADGWICILPYTDANWDDMFQLADAANLADDPRFATTRGRHSHMDVLLRWLDEITPGRTTGAWLELCGAREIPATGVLDLEDAIGDQYVLGQGVLTRREHPTEGTYFATSTPVRLSGTPTTFRRHAPRLGEDTAAVLKDLGYSPDEITLMVARGVVSRPEPAIDSSGTARVRGGRA